MFATPTALFRQLGGETESPAPQSNTTSFDPIALSSRVRISGSRGMRTVLYVDGQPVRKVLWTGGAGGGLRRTKGYKKSTLIARLIREHLDRERFDLRPSELKASRPVMPREA
jgi:hypothetical protein